MKPFAIFLACAIAIGVTATRPGSAAPVAVVPIPADRIERYEHIKAHLPPAMRAKLASIEPYILDRLKRAPGDEIAGIARSSVSEHFGGVANKAQVRGMTFAVVFDAAKLQSDRARSLLIRGRSMSDTKSMDLQVQLAMDRKSQFEAVLSNMMKSYSNTASSIVQNLTGGSGTAP